MNVTKMTDKIHKFYNKTDFGRFLIESGKLTQSELLFLIPNGTRHMLGLPTSRFPCTKNKKKEFLRRYNPLICKVFLASFDFNK